MDKTVEGKNIYHSTKIPQKVILTMKEMNSNYLTTLQKKIAKKIEGRCITEGYVRPQSVRIYTHSCGLISDKDTIEFDTIVDCDTAMFVAGTLVEAKVKSVILAGVLAEHPHIEPSPFVLYLLKEHQSLNNPNVMDPLNQLKVGDIFTARVTFQQLKLNQEQLELTGELAVTYHEAS